MADLRRWSRSEITRMRHEMDQLFDDLCSDFDLPALLCRMTGDLEIREENKLLVARLELGHINPEDVSISVFDRRLIIYAELAESVGNRTAKRSFKKEIKLPCVIRTEDVHAEFSDGVLEIQLPKCPRQRGTSVTIVMK